jgi:hypothetical protein
VHPLVSVSLHKFCESQTEVIPLSWCPISPLRSQKWTTALLPVSRDWYD